MDQLEFTLILLLSQYSISSFAILKQSDDDEVTDTNELQKVAKFW